MRIGADASGLGGTPAVPFVMAGVVPAIGTKTLRVMAGVGPPSTPCSADPNKIVGGRPVPAMTGFADRAATGPFILQQALRLATVRE
jgi:hypothetical protein